MIHPAPATPATLSLTGRTGALGAVAALLGFHPIDSVVLLCLTGPRRRVGPVLRVDLDPVGPLDPGTVVQLVDFAARYAHEVMVVIYSDTPVDTPPEIGDLVAALAMVCTVLDVLAAPNTPQPVPVDLMAATVLQGRAVLSSRSELARSVEHDQTAPPTPAVADIIAAVGSISGRDRWIMARLGDAVAVVELLAAARATPDSDPRAAELCAVLAVLAYRHGDGALAQVAVDRALRSAPEHRLAQLMLAVMACGMAPADLDTVVTAQPA